MDTQPDKFCFFISPIGERDSAERDRSDTVKRVFLDRIFSRFGYRVVRGDQLTDLGRIEDQEIEAINDADVAVADLTGLNPNVMYELGVRHALGGPVIIMAQAGTSLPFDTAALRTVIYDLSDPMHLAETQEYLEEVVGRLADGEYYTPNPVLDRLSRRKLGDSENPVAQSLERIENTVANLARQLEGKDQGLRQARFHLNNGSIELAVEEFESFLAGSPHHTEALIGLARAQRRLGLFERAIDTVSTLIESQPKNPQGRYNLSCYLALAGRPVEQVVEELGCAIEISHRYRRYAQTDPDFESIRAAPEFVEVTAG